MSILPTHEAKSTPSTYVCLPTAIRRALRESPYLAIRSLQVDVADGRLLLKGKVASYYLKQVAQTHAVQAAAGHSVVNEIEVM